MLFLVAGVGVFVGTCAAAGTAAKVSQTMPVAADPLAIAAQLVELRPLTPDKVFQATGIRLERRSDESNESFDVYRSAAGRGAIKDIELRYSSKDRPGKGELLILNLNPGSPIHREDVREKFGPDPEISIPRPGGRKDAPNYYVYRRTWGAVKFGLRRSGDEELVSVILDATSQ